MAPKTWNDGEWHWPLASVRFCAGHMMQFKTIISALLGSLIAAFATVVVGLLAFELIGMDEESLVVRLFEPFFMVLLLPGGILGWAFVLGDNGTSEQHMALAIAISLPINTTVGAIVGMALAWWQRWR